ncbi:MAG: hypothetical protein R3D55_21600, partial [Chloroflexota bacterium]
VSVASDGTQANWHAYHPSISSDGRYVAFDSFADNLVPGDTNMDYGGMTDVFVHDRSTSETTRVSVDSNGTPGNENSDYPGISADGRYVAFHSTANNYVPNDTTNSSDIFVHDRVTDETTIVSISSSGEYGNFQSMYPSVSADGRYVAFESLATNLVPNQTTNPFLDVYVHDRNTGNTAIASVTSDGTSGNSDSNRPKISPDGRYVAFGSNASNLVSDDTNGEPDAFVYDRITEETIILSRTNDGAEANSGSGTVCLSNEGRYAAFISDASNLVPDDDNGRIDVFVYDRDWMLSTSQLIYLPFIVKP